ncbi:MAG: Uma2 family endonuclease [Planctomycetes bacterium]|nr:Uma2 family endonuclease [Planctomycetota bacterium]
MADTLDFPRRSKRGEPVWELALLEFPLQGQWTEEEFLQKDLPNVEFVDGCLEFLPVPTEKHQMMLEFFFLALNAFVTPKKLGKVHVAGLRVRTVPRQIRLPDVAFVRAENFNKRDNIAWRGADLVFEVVSPGGEGRERDTVVKREEYARAGIAEYWIADYEKGVLLVLALQGDKYVEHSVAKRGEIARSKLLPGFEVKAAELLDAE